MEDQWLSRELAQLILLWMRQGSFQPGFSDSISWNDSVKNFQARLLGIFPNYSSWLQFQDKALRISLSIISAQSISDTSGRCLCLQFCYNFIIRDNINQMRQFIKQSALFLFLAGGIYACYLVSAIYHQKLLKEPYIHRDTEEPAYFSESLLFTLFPPLVATIIGQVILTVQGQTTSLPWSRCIVISSIINVNMFTYNQAVVYASFPAVVMAKSCSLLSVIIVGVFFSRVRDSKLKLTRSKLLIGLVATAGIILFNFFKKQEKSEVDHSISFFSLGNLFLMISLIGDGFLPDFQAQLKAEFKPSTIEMYCLVNRYTFLISFTLSLISNSATVMLDFIMNYEDFGLDVLKFSVLNAVGQLFIYRMIKQFRQHIPAFVIAFRKCLTVIINILWFHHSINKQQLIGITFVFVAVLWEVYSNYKEQEERRKAQFQKINQNDSDSGENLQLSEQIRGQQSEPETKLDPPVSRT